MTLDANTKGMSTNDYQRQAIKTDQVKDLKESISNSISNLTEEVGSLLRWYQQDISNEKSNELSLFKAKAPSKLGDILWYIANIASRLDISLNEIAESNLEKTRKRWPSGNEGYSLFDDKYPHNEQIPREMEFYIKELQESRKVVLGIEATHGVFMSLGDQIDDNAKVDDGYRFHDVLHIAYATYLGWSPVLRGMFKHKRKSNREVDVNEDGARARDLEEALTAMVFEYSKNQDYFEGQDTIDFKIIKLVERITLSKEVSARAPKHWQEAIINGYKVFREVRKNRSGVVSMNLKTRTLLYKQLTQEKSIQFFGE